MQQMVIIGSADDLRAAGYSVSLSAAMASKDCEPLGYQVNPMTRVAHTAILDQQHMDLVCQGVLVERI